MKTNDLIGTKEIWDCNNMKIKLEYYLVATKSKIEEKETLYGIQIIKCQREEREMQKEVEAITGISYSRKLVEQIITSLMDNTVTPMCMLEIVDDYIAREMMFT
ncbi:MAG: hypothetical protein GX913_04075 [Clostridiales bacterium]|nr:hypothetical protein [Clostridiales bacterium]